MLSLENSVTKSISSLVREAHMVREMNLEGDSGLSVSCGNGKLRQWLIDQINSSSYPGLVWENGEKSIFRIPWKHAGKQDYNRDEDAALFKAWALFKGKHREGVDKPDPPTWKTRLRCALNKSNDFDELVERSQLDISDPYKVYRIIPEGAKRGIKTAETTLHMSSESNYPMHSLYPTLHSPVSGSYIVPQERKEWKDYSHTQDHQQQPQPQHHQPPHVELQYSQCHYPSPLSRLWHTGPHTDNGYQFTGSFYSYSSSESHPTAFTMDHNMATLSDFRLHVSLFYREALVKKVTTSGPEGCQITSSSSSSSSSSSPSSPCPVDKLYSGAEVVLFPSPYPESQRRGAEKLPNVLERGVLLWMASDGLYAKRLCQSRVYWEGPLAPYTDKPNKLEKEQTCKLFDTQQFLTELQGYAQHGRPMPRHQVVLCFGDEYPDPQRQTKMITAQVEPMFARELLYFTQQNSSHYLRDYELQGHTESSPPAPGDYQRTLQHMQE
ncbi:interferon regulatory factor 4 isoform X2 [Oncorhynchus kisutch]|uniref:Interferon regulatory factor 4a n=1 Tax=Oncorhynchus kisutch TaxID=8019 RepID=A0A8C7I3U6_ONCKI|nr:interferon regulatory factor 4 isoform X2 [Oncorhynchus kisutch]